MSQLETSSFTNSTTSVKLPGWLVRAAATVVLGCIVAWLTWVTDRSYANESAIDLIRGDQTSLVTIFNTKVDGLYRNQEAIERKLEANGNKLDRLIEIQLEANRARGNKTIWQQ